MKKIQYHLYLLQKMLIQYCIAWSSTTIYKKPKGWKSWIANYRESYAYILNTPLSAPFIPVLPAGNFGDH